MTCLAAGRCWLLTFPVPTLADFLSLLLTLVRSFSTSKQFHLARHNLPISLSPFPLPHVFLLPDPRYPSSHTGRTAAREGGRQCESRGDMISSDPTNPAELLSALQPSLSAVTAGRFQIPISGVSARQQSARRPPPRSTRHHDRDVPHETQDDREQVFSYL